jgi:hypothetical protein
VFLSGYVRPYALAHALVPLGFWLTVEVFSSSRLTADKRIRLKFRVQMPSFPPRIVRSPSLNSGRGSGGGGNRLALPAIALTLTLAASFWTTLIAPIWIAFFGLFTLIVYPLRRSITRWIPIAIGFIALSIPILIARGDLASGRNVQVETPPFFAGMTQIFADYFGAAGWVWAALLIAAAVAFVTSSPPPKLRRVALALAGWAFGGTLSIYLVNARFAFFQPSYLFWTLTGWALLGGVLLAHLPAFGRWGAASLIAVLMFLPVPARVEQNYTTGSTQAFTWLRDHVRAGDVLVVDPGFNCLAPYELDYHIRAFFPDGLVVTPAVSDARRVWYAVNQNTQDHAFADAQTARRQPSIFVGSPTCLFRLYEAPPNVQGVAYENGLRFHGAYPVEALPDQFVPYTYPLAAREGETIRARLWWSVDDPPPADYSIGLYLIDPGTSRIVAQYDSAPQVAPDPPETSRWQPGRYYIETRELILPYPLVTDEYQLRLAVYQWWDGVRLTSPGADADALTDLFTIHVKSW